MPTKEFEQQQIIELLQNVNLAWSSGNPEDLKNYFDDKIFILSPDMKILGSGKQNCIKSYIDFLNHATVIDFKENVPDVFVFDNTAIAFYSYSISWKTGDKLFNETGREMYMLDKKENKWLIVMRKLVATD